MFMKGKTFDISEEKSCGVRSLILLTDREVKKEGER
jgi:hypothetical protein